MILGFLILLEIPTINVQINTSSKLQILSGCTRYETWSKYKEIDSTFDKDMNALFV